jgi:hypothetical protein
MERGNFLPSLPFMKVSSPILVVIEGKIMILIYFLIEFDAVT